MSVTTEHRPAPSSTQEEQVRALVTEKASATSTKDAARLVALYTEDVDVFDLAPPLRQPASEVRDPSVKQAWFDTFEQEMGYEVRDLVVAVSGDVAFCHGLGRLEATPRGTTEGFVLWFRTTMCLRLVDGAWKISHEHESTPFYMDGSFLAATDLQP